MSLSAMVGCWKRDHKISSEETKIPPSSTAVRQLWNDVEKSTVKTATKCPHKSQCSLHMRQNLQVEWVNLYQLTENTRLTVLPSSANVRQMWNDVDKSIVTMARQCPQQSHCISSEETNIRPSSAAVRQAWTDADQSTVITGARCPRKFNAGLNDEPALSI